MLSPRRVTLLLLLSLGATPAFAAWPHSQWTNLPVCTATGDQTNLRAVSDDAGGMIVVWQDARIPSNVDIYAQHVLATGVVDPAWPANGRVVCNAVNGQSNPVAVADGAGGAFVAWQDSRSVSSWDIYAGHVLASGAVDPLWPVGGCAVSQPAFDQTVPAIVADGTGAILVTWQDFRSGTNLDIYAQRVLATGVVDPAWPVDGRALCTAAADQSAPLLVADGTGGAIVSWQDFRVGAWDVYAQHVLGTGAVDPAWPVDGRAICSAAGNQLAQRIVTDGAGGAILAWEDDRNAASSGKDVYAMRVRANGTLDPGWTAGGRALCNVPGNQITIDLIADGSGGALATWLDGRASLNLYYNLAADHVLSNGVPDPAWIANGNLIVNDPYFGGLGPFYSQFSPMACSDGAGGAIVAWHDSRGALGLDVYALDLTFGGPSAAGWSGGPRVLSSNGGNQQLARIVSDGAGGALVAWQDDRNGTQDIYAQRIARFDYLGTPEAEITQVADVPNDNGGHVKVAWNASYLDALLDANLGAYDLYRSVPPNVAAQARASGALRTLRAGEAFAPRPGDVVAFAAGAASATSYAWEYLQSVTPNHFAGQYSVLAPTAFDSLGAGNPKTAFLVVARNSTSTVYWPSTPALGYSVDNVPPVTPAPFIATSAAGTTHLHWSPNPDADLAGYRLYRGPTPAFTPSPATLLASPADTGYADATAGTFTYKLSAVDIHGNESAVATATPAGTTGVLDGAAPGELALANASPNPAARGTTLRFALPVAARVRLGIYDAAGRHVRTLAAGTLPAGVHGAAWDLCDGGGHRLGAGLYFARLDAGGRTLVRRIAVTP